MMYNEVPTGLQIKYLLDELEMRLLTNERAVSQGELLVYRDALQKLYDHSKGNDPEGFGCFSVAMEKWIVDINGRIGRHVPYEHWLALHGGPEREAQVELPFNGAEDVSVYFGTDPVFVTEYPIYCYRNGAADGLVDGDIYGLHIPTRTPARAFLVEDKYGIQVYAKMYPLDVTVNGQKYSRFPAANVEERDAIRQYLRTDDDPEARHDDARDERLIQTMITLARQVLADPAKIRNK